MLCLIVSLLGMVRIDIMPRERQSIRGEACGTCRAAAQPTSSSTPPPSRRSVAASPCTSVPSRLLISCLAISFLGHVGRYRQQSDRIVRVLDLKDTHADEMLTREDIEMLGLEQSPFRTRKEAKRSRKKRRKRRLEESEEEEENTTMITTNKTAIVAGIDDMQLDTNKRGACGYRKCFFHSSTNEIEGYLVARGGHDYMSRLERIWQVARRLEETYSTRQFLLEEPQLVQVPDMSTLKRLNKMARQSVRTSKKSMYYGNTQKEPYEKARVENPDTAHTVAIQRVQLAPTPNMIVRCSFFEFGREGAFRFDDQSSTKEEFAQAAKNYFGDEISFMNALAGELKQLIRLLGHEPELWYDFQFMVDYTGAIYHIDLDRIEMKGYRFPSSRGAESCLRGFLGGIGQVVTADGDN